MAPAECGKVLALLSLAASLLVLLLLADVQPPPSCFSFSPVADLLHAALGRLLDLATRWNMVLLCHAILLVLLGDAGLLGTPVGRRRRGQVCSEATAAATTCYYYYSAPEQRSPRATRSNVLVACTDLPAAMDGKTITHPMNESEEEETVDEGQPAVLDEQHREEKEEEDLDEMNRRFEALIADTKAKMRLEALQTSRGTTTC
jgi:hypothetical protein